MKTTELVDIERALDLVEQVIVRGGEEGEHLAAQTQVPALASGISMGVSASADWRRNLVQRRLAIRKSLRSAKDLLVIAQQLMSAPEGQATKDFTVQKKAMLQEIRRAARRTYEAGHLLIGIDLKS